jgi:hypothetical protein
MNGKASTRFSLLLSLTLAAVLAACRGGNGESAAAQSNGSGESASVQANRGAHRRLRSNHPGGGRSDPGLAHR